VDGSLPQRRRESCNDPAMTWSEELAAAVAAAGVTAVAAVPDKRLDPTLGHLAGRGVAIRLLPSEEECVGYACGRLAAGGRVVVACQSSGLGNAVNALASLAVPYGLGLPLLVSMRGGAGEENLAQLALGHGTRAVLEAVGCRVHAVAAPGSVGPLARAWLATATATGSCVALLLEAELELVP
jgi:sulfopyruvate decarboxylase subunit alpha